MLFCLSVGAQSLQEIQTKAESGDAYSQYLLGWNIANKAAKPDYSAAKPWFEKASANGYAAASYYLGWMYYYGMGVEENHIDALKWFEKAEAQGMPEAHEYAVTCKSDSAMGVTYTFSSGRLDESSAPEESKGNSMEAKGDNTPDILEQQGVYCQDIIVDHSKKGYEWLKNEEWNRQGDGVLVSSPHHYYTTDTELGCFDAQGTLKIANLNPYAMGTSEMTDLMLYALLRQDYAQNKYSIKSAGAKTQQYIHGELGLGPVAKRKQDPAKAYVNYLKTERAERNARNSYERRRANQASQRAALGVFNALYSNVDAKGDEWIGKLKRQHNEELHLYKVERLSPVSFKLIFLDDNGNYTHSLKFTAVQSGKFNFKWKASVLPNDASFKLQRISYRDYQSLKNGDE